MWIEYLELLDSALCKNLNDIDSFEVNYNDDSSSDLHRASTEQHLIVHGEL